MTTQLIFSEKLRSLNEKLEQAKKGMYMSIQ